MSFALSICLTVVKISSALSPLQCIIEKTLEIYPHGDPDIFLITKSESMLNILSLTQNIFIFIEYMVPRYITFFY